MKNLIFLFSWLIPGLALAQSYSIDWYKVGTGGTSSNAQYSVSDTIGQPDAGGAMSGGNYSVTGGFWSLISVVQTSGAPGLTIQRINSTTLKVLWPYPATGWTLQQNPNLATASWSASGGVSNDGTNNFITITSPTGNLFFRLSHP